MGVEEKEQEEEEDIFCIAAAAADVVVDCHCRFSICRSSEITRGEEEAVVVIAEAIE